MVLTDIEAVPAKEFAIEKLPNNKNIIAKYIFPLDSLITISLLQILDC